MLPKFTHLIRFACLIMVALSISKNVSAEELCRIEIIDNENGWPVPLVELRTTHKVRFVSDNAGIIAFDLPELMGKETWFFVEGHGYGVPEDRFRYRGLRLTPEPGKKLVVKVKRELPAKRLGRITGAGIFAESQRFGLNSGWEDQGVLGCDSVQTTVHNGRLYWAWGDTTLAKYPLGIFHVSSATTIVKPLNSFKPPVRLRYNYFSDDKGIPRAVGKMPGKGPTWISGYVSLPDKNGKQHLVSTYVKVKPPLEIYETGLCDWDAKKKKFNRLKVLWTKSEKNPEAPLCPDGHPVFWNDRNGKKWLLFGDPFPRLKCEANFESWSQPDTWQPLEPQKSVRSSDGKELVKPHRGSIAWSSYKKKWVTVFTQMYGKPSSLGELWYAEADQPIGPWGPAIKVVTHNNYSFYNPRLHPEFTDKDSPILLFEATYTKMFANHAESTPRHDYNQILYRLDLDNAQLRLSK
jgi:hypothetical protein